MNTNTCTECGQPGATDMTIRLGDELLNDVRAHVTCATAIQRRYADWLISPEGRIAQAVAAGADHCGRCGTEDDLNTWSVTDADGNRTEARACTPCAVQAMEAHPAATIRRVPTEGDDLYGCTGAAAQWIRDNVGLN